MDHTCVCLVCGVWRVVCGVWCEWCAVCGVWCVVCGVVWCGVCVCVCVPGFGGGTYGYLSGAEDHTDQQVSVCSG